MLDGGHDKRTYVLATDPTRDRDETHHLTVAAVESEGHALARRSLPRSQSIRAPARVANVQGSAAVVPACLGFPDVALHEKTVCLHHLIDALHVRPKGALPGRHVGAAERGRAGSSGSGAGGHPRRAPPAAERRPDGGAKSPMRKRPRSPAAPGHDRTAEIAVVTTVWQTACRADLKATWIKISVELQAQPPVDFVCTFARRRFRPHILRDALRNAAVRLAPSAFIGPRPNIGVDAASSVRWGKS